ncbi:hypothetical protein [Bacillus sp. JCM 19034]|uniref:hypothetical protein n=1 Tax=Bacillus sp. JCM 19034 TaxID=1481928 RepID=UPI000781AE6E|nr:hypothetical protein [Bacillus sp. JCM 19034]
MKKRSILYIGAIISFLFIIIFYFQDGSKVEVVLEGQEHTVRAAESPDDVDEVSSTNDLYLTRTIGDVTLIREEEEISITDDTSLMVSDRIITGSNSSVEMIVNVDESVLIGANTEIILTSIEKVNDRINVSMKQLSGFAFHMGEHDDYSIELGSHTVYAEGTYFATFIDPDTFLVGVTTFSGVVGVRQPNADVSFEERRIYPFQD